MKTLVAKLSLVALIAAPLLSPAQHHLRPADKLGSLTLLPGPHFLSPADATGEVVPGQIWELKKGLPQFNGRPGKLSLGTSAGSGAFRSPLSSPTLTVSGGTFTLRPATTPAKEDENSVRMLKPVAKPSVSESLRFDSKLPPTEIRPLQKTPPPAGSNLKLRF